MQKTTLNDDLKAAQLLVDKSRRIIQHWNNISEVSIVAFLEDLITAMNIVSYMILKLKTNREGTSRMEFDELERDDLTAIGFEEEVYNIFFFISSIKYRNIRKAENGIKITGWKNNKTITIKQLEHYLDIVEKLIKFITRKFNYPE